jgi:diguanylate cyclase (GGDEF)-like protein
MTDKRDNRPATGSTVYLFGQDEVDTKEEKKIVAPKSPQAIDDYQIFNEDELDDHRMMEFALWGSGLSVWSWHRDPGEIVIKAFQNGQYREQNTYASFAEFCDNVHADEVNELKRKWQSILNQSLVSFEFTLRFLFSNEYRWLLLKGRVTSLDDNGVNMLVGTFEDVTDQKNNESQSHIMSYAFAQTSQPMLILEKNLRIVDVNAAFYNQIDPHYTPLNNTNFATCVTLTKSDVYNLDTHGFLEKQTEYTPSNIDSHDATLPVRLAFNLFHARELNQDYYIVALTNLSERLKNDAILYRLANYDSLTGLLNRRALKSSLDTLIKEKEELAQEGLSQHAQFSLCYIDFEGFKQINEAFGHEHGDSVLESIGDKMRSILTDALFLARWGGDELIVVFSEVDHAGVSERIRSINTIIANEKINLNGQVFNLHAHLGVALFPDHGSSSSELIRNADAALYHAKAEEGCDWKLYTQGMTDDQVKQITFVNDIRQAIANNELNFVLQGKFDQNRNLIGAEALCRWQSNKHGFVSPGVFIPLIEKHGMEYQLGELALDNAMSYITLLGSNGISIPISVNISSSQFLQAAFIDLAKTLLAKHNIDASLIELEITESVFMVDESLATQNFQRIHELGFRISLDDFGTGYSSLSYLSKYHFDVVKIDRQFIINLADNLKAQKLFSAILNLCSALDIETVVEGIETEEQFQLLTDSGVTKFQGFLLGRPTPFNDFTQAHVLS